MSDKRTATIQVKLTQDEKQALDHYLAILVLKKNKKYTLSSFARQSIMRYVTQGLEQE